MKNSGQKSPYRVIIIDDNELIHKDMKRILNKSDTTDSKNSRINSLEEDLFGTENKRTIIEKKFDLSFAQQGIDGFRLVQEAMRKEAPYTVAIVDMRMPPGWDGLETIENIWKVAPETQIILCTAYSDYSWSQINNRLNHSDNFLILKKPFDATELQQMVGSMSSKWSIARENKSYIDQLKVAKLNAEAGLVAKSDFLSLINHEFRTPLNIIGGVMEYVQNSKGVESDSKEMLSEAKKATSTLIQILDDILEYINLDLTESKSRHSTYNFANLIAETSSLYTTLAGSRNLQFSVVVSPSLQSTLMGDEKKVRKVFNHLLNNAFKHTERGSIKVELEGEESSDNRVHITMSIADTGDGIDASKIETIFDSFTQGEEPLDRTKAGIGLGLSICQKIVTHLDGSINVESTPGQGTKFTVDFYQKKPA